MDRFIVILRGISVRKRLLYAFLILCVIPILVMIIISSVVEYIYYNYNLEKNYENFGYESSVRVNDAFKQLESKFEYLKENNDILTDLYLYDTSAKYQTERVEMRIENTIKSIMSTQEEIGYASVFFPEGKPFSYSRGNIIINDIRNISRKDKAWYSIEQDGKTLLCKMEDAEIDYTSGRSVTFVALVNMEKIEALMKNAAGTSKHKLVLLDEDEKMIAGAMYNEADAVYEVVYTVPDTGLRVKSTFMKKPYQLKGLAITLLLFGIVLIVSGTIIYLVHESIRIPLEGLLNRIRQIRDDDMLVVNDDIADKETNDEHEILNNEFTAMLIRLNELLEETYITKINETELRTRIKELELISLQQRINPHFFYNLLDNVFWMAQMEGYEEIGEMVSTLGEFFKTSVSEKGVFVSIHTEIENVKSYVCLQEIMHKNQFEARWDIDNNIVSYQTVKLVLQPIIENCIVHGFEGVEEGGLIQITGKERADSIIFEVRDNGKGMTEETCNQIKVKMNSANLGVGDSIGMRNVNQRIKIYFGETYGVDIKSKVNEGTTVTLRIPKKE